MATHLQLELQSKFNFKAALTCLFYSHCLPNYIIWWNFGSPQTPMLHSIHFDDQKIHSQHSPSGAYVGESVRILIISTYIYSKTRFLAKW